MKKYLFLALCILISIGAITGCGSKKNMIEKKDGYTEGTVILGSNEKRLLIEDTKESYKSGDTIKIQHGYGALALDNNEVSYLNGTPGTHTVNTDIKKLYKLYLLIVQDIKFNSYFTYNGKKYNYESKFNFRMEDPKKLVQAYTDKEVSVKTVVEDIIKPYLENNLSNALIEFSKKNGVNNLTANYDDEIYFDYDDYLDEKEIEKYKNNFTNISITSVK